MLSTTIDYLPSMPMSQKQADKMVAGVGSQTAIYKAWKKRLGGGTAAEEEVSPDEGTSDEDEGLSVIEQFKQRDDGW